VVFSIDSISDSIAESCFPTVAFAWMTTYFPSRPFLSSPSIVRQFVNSALSFSSGHNRDKPNAVSGRSWIAASGASLARSSRDITSRTPMK